MKFVSVDMKFKGMRKNQSFTIYPVLVTDETFLIQSNQRIGRVNLELKQIYLSKGRSNGSYGIDLCDYRGAKMLDLSDEQCDELAKAKLDMASGTNSDRSFTLDIGA